MIKQISVRQFSIFGFHKTTSNISKIYFRHWQETDEQILKEKFEQYGPAWSLISSQLPGRKADECRHHWLNMKWKSYVNNHHPTTTTTNSKDNITKTDDTDLYLESPSITLRNSFKPFDSEAKIPDQENSNFQKKNELTKKIKNNVNDLKKENKSLSVYCPLLKDKSSLIKMSPQQKEEWTLYWKGYEKVFESNNDNDRGWVQFPIENPGLSPSKRLNANMLSKGRLPLKRFKKNIWSVDEDMILREAFEEFGYDWKSISYCIPQRTPYECRKRMTYLYMHLHEVNGMNK